MAYLFLAYTKTSYIFWEIMPKDIEKAIPLNENWVINIEDEIMKTAKLIILPIVCFRIKSFNNK